ncbi:thiamine-phosphate kinase [Leucobacter salsicius]|uniref:thiamine-phosphate kinase n=1 Tax=Leucobacter salsicius TaxID=664638 RepID=UPI00047615F3|nr:thiamine-phosphate kinase [Leucobacter salsicius]
MGHSLTVGQAGERQVLARVLAQLSHANAATLGPGDDCAVLGADDGYDTVVTTDTMIEGPDFRLAWHGGFELGWKLVATNLSDVAAMGAEPTALTLALAVPHETPVALLEEIAEGADAACRTLAPGCGVVGGDLGTAPVIMAAVSALGRVKTGGAVTRSGARVGDTVAYAGELGLAGLGLSLLFREASDGGVAHARTLATLWQEHPEVLAAQLAPTPPIPLGPIAGHTGATAMMDVSDGLSLDAARLAKASGVSIDLASDSLREGFGLQQGIEVPIQAMLEGGEDHGLLATFAPGARLPDGFRAIGRVLEARPDPELLLDGNPYAPGGWDPFAPIAISRRG